MASSSSVSGSGATIAPFVGSIPNASATGPVQKLHSSWGVENTHVPVSKSSLSRNSSARHSPGSTWTIMAPVWPSARLTAPVRPPQTGG